MKALVFLVILLGFAVALATPFILGVGGCGPTNVVSNVVVTNKHVDYSGSGDERKSHYMVGTDKGTFEVDNGFMLGVWNADEIYNQMIVGKSYDITTKGNKVVGMFYQEYPYIVAVRQSK